MKNQLKIALLSLLGVFIASKTGADQMIIDNFTSDSSRQWNYVSDQVMGGVSQGEVRIINNGAESYAQLTGEVSTENNGGFIQFRTDISTADKLEANGIYLKVRGNNQQYFVHLRTRGTLLPWQYYQSAFKVNDGWQTIKLPLESFAPSSNWLRKKIKTSGLKSIGIVAFGRDHSANVSVSEVGFY